MHCGFFLSLQIFCCVQLSFLLIDNDLQFNETVFSFIVDGMSRCFAPFLSTTRVK